MQCSNCGSDNVPGRKFCSQCGNALEAVAPAATSASNDPAAQPATSSSSPASGTQAAGPAPQPVAAQAATSANGGAAAGFLRAVNRDPTGLLALPIVLVLTTGISLVGWFPLSLPIRLFSGFVAGGNCVGLQVSTPQMYVCSAFIAGRVILVPLLFMVVVFALRVPITALVKRLTPLLPEGVRFLVPPVLATGLFVISWGAIHQDTWLQVGVVPQILFPVVIGLFTYGVMRYSPLVQRFAGDLFTLRDRVPWLIRLAAVIALPMLLALIITFQARVTQEALKEQFVVMVALGVGYLALAPLAARKEDKEEAAS